MAEGPPWTYHISDNTQRGIMVTSWWGQQPQLPGSILDIVFLESGLRQDFTGWSTLVSLCHCSFF